MNNGWIKIHRQLLDNPLCKRPHWGWLWVVLLLMANHEEEKFIWNGETITIGRGQFITGRKKLSEISKIPESTIEDILKFLERQHQIRQQKTTKYRLITIVNWESYQKTDNKSNNRATTEQQQSNTNKNEKKYKNEENKIDTAEQGSAGIPHLIDLFRNINPSYRKFFSNKTQRAACDRLLKSHEMEKLEKILKLLPRTNTLDYFPVITTPVQLEDKFASLAAAMQKLKNNQPVIL